VQRIVPLHVVSGFVDGDAPSTRAAVQTLANAVADRRNVLVVLDRDDATGWRSLRNVAGVHLLVPDQLNTYDVLVSDDVIFTTTALERFLAGVRAGKPGGAAADRPASAAGSSPSAGKTAVAEEEDQ
jgi:large subunit ribosomal protein L4